jgi:NADH dehydrogenase
MHPERSDKHVVIVGGGFAGLGCARALARQRGVRVTLLDRNNYHQFQPMLYQVATSQLAPADVAYSLRKVFIRAQNVDLKLADVVSVDPAARSVKTKTGEVYQGDYLVIAAGSRPNFFKTPGADQHTFPLYSLDDAERLRSRILEVFEDADREPSLIEQGALNFVIVGAGPTGVETAGALADLIRVTMASEYKDLPTDAARIHVIDQGPRVLAAFSERAHDYAAKVLQDLGVHLHMGISVKEIGPGHVLLSDGSTIRTRVVVWAGGLKAASLAGSSGLPQGRGGRIDVQPDLTAAGFPNVFVLGDLANTHDPSGSFFPQLGSVALQAGQWTAANILADVAGKARTPFKYHDKGIMAMISRSAAVVELGESRHELHGMVAVAAWLGVHAYLLSGIRTRIEAFIDWTWTYFARARGPQVLDRSDAARINWEEDAVAVPERPVSAAPPSQPLDAPVGDRPVSYWLGLLAREEEPAQQEAVAALSRLGPAAVPKLIDGLKDDDWQIRNQAAVVLGTIGPAAKAAVPALVDALQDEDKYLRTHAAGALGKIGPDAKAAVPALIRALRDNEEDVRREVAAALGHIGPDAKEALPALVELFNDPRKPVRKQAIQAAEEIDPEVAAAHRHFWSRFRDWLG